jgi:AbrB family looped-hinge helix DNA binding protein
MAHSIDHNIVLRNVDQWSIAMTAVKVSPKFQVVIPKDAREQLGLKAGQELQVLVYEGRIELIPVEPLENLRGFLKGIDTTVERDPDRV